MCCVGTRQTTGFNYSIGFISDVVLKTEKHFCNVSLIFMKKLLCQYIKIIGREIIETEFQKQHAHTSDILCSYHFQLMKT